MSTNQEFAKEFLKLYRVARSRTKLWIIREFIGGILSPIKFDDQWLDTITYSDELKLLTRIIEEYPETKIKLEALMFRMI